MIKSSYLKFVYDQNLYSKVIDEMMNLILDLGIDFDAIAFTGQSGSALAYPLSLKLNKPLINIRKKETKSHYSDVIEGFIGFSNYIIVDDVINDGETINYIVSNLNLLEQNPKCKGIFLFKDYYHTYFNSEYNIPVYSLMYRYTENNIEKEIFCKKFIEIFGTKAYYAYGEERQQRLLSLIQKETGIIVKENPLHKFLALMVSKGDIMELLFKTLLDKMNENNKIKG